ncbi:bifunctional 5,10-methylenetetrahydrofolate dehydrogenase/5,10-methenyltetrahydrofolate cyclohydrolase [Pseudoflavonifractor phocaeensis]|uniref:bifunctional 5,10-methylenetetrahydrofolate dehydrogenase/5,10-methenyltetrahydrofolate cyclohydrolase n=1 Tax=Pseudoflavonifractor phocaeensis TaxID=1870988 RepID=UPI001958B208|nr:bifunctional 5,10-methylenetetrahydrofolate dehydrogenase/5,10-methenyltetrahydrofolate cyclohydrolase [Pseudoflavonifractor phocaeensis]MBM6721979.1 bifunctional 5,10-methylenetetrahydrofolate dehydrogenase/5,10-methenyltetrahydrofolate cyclohydrolase [Pseudoflavonifractor phocaeensis]MBM6884423.1 bifunctional 5,10-methylenetetrahydrofolate dehydrogenase/5,10-methenyltetrahydrofolate cyclohydrolase [Pseudoflavonifractor phocaeensis]
MAQLWKGAPVAAALTEELSQRAQALVAKGITPTLAIVRVGERPEDLSYERGALKRCEKVGIAVRQYLLTAASSQTDLMEVIEEINRDDSIHGCLLFRPLPKHMDEAAICAALSPAKDVDGITAGSLAAVFSGSGAGYPPCTAQACLEILDHYGYELKGKRAVVVGRSLVIGKPVSMLLLGRHATVTICHTRTADLPAECRRADVLVAAAGKAGAVSAQCLAPGQVVLDVGINVDENGNLVGDVDFAAAENTVEAITPVPGGVGAVTTSVLARHVIEAAEKAIG